MELAQSAKIVKIIRERNNMSGVEGRLDLKFYRLATLAVALIYPVWHFLIPIFYPEAIPFFISSVSVSALFLLVAVFTSMSSPWFYKNLKRLYLFQIVVLISHLFWSIHFNATIPSYLLVQFIGLTAVGILMIFLEDLWFYALILVQIFLELLLYFPKLNYLDGTFSLAALSTGFFFYLVLRYYFIKKNDYLKNKIWDQQRSAIDELSENYERERAIASILKITNQSHDLETKLYAALEAIFKISWLKIESKGGIFLKSSEERLELVASYKLHYEIMKQCKYVEKGHCLCGKVLETRKMVYADCVDHDHDTTFDGMKDHGHYVLPIQIGPKFLGVMVLYLEKGHIRNDSEIKFLESVVDTLGALIDAHLTQKRAEKLEQEMLAVSKLATLGEMAGSLGHEIKNPLSVVNGYSMILEQMGSGEIPYDQSLLLKTCKQINGTISKITEIIDGLKRFTRNETSDPMIRCKLLDIVMDVVELTRKKCQRANVPLSLPEIDQNLTIFCHPTQICQILMNLVSNSVDAVTDLPERWIKVELNQTESEISIAVIDSGRGLPPDIASKLMTPFFTTKPPGKGTGLGLSICAKIALLHGGRVHYEQDNNTKFILTLPRKGV